MSTMDKIGYKLQALVRRYRRWMAKPKLFGFDIVFAAVLIAVALSTISVVDEGMDTVIEEADLRESVAKAVEQTPDVWLERLEEKKGKGSEYEYQLEYQRYRWFARNAPSLAERIRDEKVWEVVKQSSEMAAEQTVQFGVGKVAGKGARVIGAKGGKVGSKLLGKGIVEGSKVYRAAGRFLGRHGRRLVVGGGPIGETASNLAWETAFTAKPKDMSPALEKAMESKENRELFKLIEKALGQDPDKMMQACLYHEITLIENDRGFLDDKDYAAAVRSIAAYHNKLTQAGGSPTSMWKDEEELAKWLASEAGRKLPEVKEEKEEEKEVTPSADRACVTAWVEDVKDSEHYPAWDCWPYIHVKGVDVTFTEREYWVEYLGYPDENVHVHQKNLHCLMFAGTGSYCDTWPFRVPNPSPFHDYYDMEVNVREVWRGVDANGNPVEVEWSLKLEWEGKIAGRKEWKREIP